MLNKLRRLKNLSLYLQLALGVLSIVTLSKTGLAKISSNDEMGLLEKSIWNAEPVEFGRLEKKVVRMIQVEPNSALAHYLLAHLLVRRFSDDPTDLAILRQASELAQQSMDLNKEQDYGYVVVAEILDLMGQQQNALKVLRSCPDTKAARSWRWYFMSARLQSEYLSLAEVEGLLAKAMDSEKSQSEVVAPYVVALLQTEVEGSALLEKLQEWQKKHGNSVFALSIASYFSGIGEYGKAHVLYRSLYNADASQKEAQLNDAILVYKDLKQLDVAQKILLELLKSKKSSLTNRSRATAEYYLGNIYLAGNMWERAQKEYLRAIAGTRDYETMLYLVIEEYNKKKAGKQLLAVLDELVTMIPGSALIFAARGQVLSDSLARHELALDSYKNALILDPNHSEYYNGMGLVYYRMKNMTEALNVFKIAADIDPTDAVARYNQACILAIQGKKEKALVSLEEAIGLDPSLQETADNDKDLDSLRSDQKFVDIFKNKNLKIPMKDEVELPDESVLTGH